MDRPLRVAIAGTGFIGRVDARGGAAGGRHARRSLRAHEGYRDCFDAFVADTYAAVRGDEPEGLPRFDNGRHAARITEAVLESAASQRWEEVPA